MNKNYSLKDATIITLAIFSMWIGVLALATHNTTIINETQIERAR